jgi:hypothetical protein
MQRMRVLVDPMGAESIVFRWPTLNRRVLLWGIFLPLAFDFKKMGDDSGVILQSVLLGLTVILGALYVSLERLSPKILTYRSTLRRVALILWLYIIFSIVPVLLWSVNIEHYLKVLLPYILFGVGLSVMCSIERRNIDPMVVITMLVWAGLIGSLWRVVYAVFIMDLPLDGIRWHILSPSLPLLIGFGVSGVYLKKQTTLSLIVLIIAINIVVLSVTRSYLVSLLFVAIGILAIEYKRRSLVYVIRIVLKLWLYAVIIFGVGIATVSLYQADNIVMWLDRITKHSTESGIDITLITRLAEYKGQMIAVTGNIVTSLFGMGIGADYQWDKSTLESLSFVVVHDSAWFGGHSTWVYPFFSSGLILGAVLPLILITALLVGYKAIPREQINKVSSGLTITFIIMTAYLGQSFTSNLFNSRYGSLLLGVIVGCLFIYSRRVTRMKLVYPI